MSSITFNEDCMEVMRRYPDKYFFTIGDPPYGLSITTRHKAPRSGADTHTHTGAALVGGAGRPFGGMRKLRQGQTSDRGGGSGKSTGSREVLKVDPTFYPVFDDSSPPDAETFRELQRVSNKLILWGGNFFLDHLGAASCMIVWDKKRRGLDQADCEIAWTNLKGQSRIFEYKWNGMLQEDMKHKEKRIHACQKPIALYRWLIQQYAEPGDVIFDPYLGSGSSRIAAYDLGFDFIGCEISKTYFDLQEERFQEYTAQGNLFLMEQDTLF